MLEILHDEQGNIKACCEWYLVNINGEYDQKGDMVWVNECEISLKYRSNGILRDIIKIILEKCPQAKFGYFWRQRKYPDRKPRIYHRAQWIKLLLGGN